MLGCMRRPPEPPRPPRDRSRTPVSRRTQGLLEAHRRNLAQRRGGKNARRRTKGIHRGLLEILFTRLTQLLDIVIQGRALHERRLQQVRDRLSWLSDPNNHPIDKSIVLPNIRSEVEGISVESESVLETVYLESSGEEDENYIEGPERPYGRNEQLNRVFRRLRDQGQLEEPSEHSRPPVLPSSSSRPPLPSSSSRPPLPPSSPRPPLLQQRPKTRAKAAPQPQRIFRNLTSSDLRRLELQIVEGQGPIEGTKAILSWDHHLVLDTYRLSLKRVSKSAGGYYPQESRRVLQTAHHQQLCRFTQIILSYCHAPYTVNNVLTCAGHQPEISRTLITRHPTGPKGKLSVVRELVRFETPFFHIDNSPEVLEEFQRFLSANSNCVWKIIGISVPRKRVIPGIIYCRNVGEALSTILERTGLA